MAVLSILKMIAQINVSKELRVYNENPSMHKRIPGFKVKLGFGLHLGWAVEGMIGSNYKADASYLSPNVNTSATLEGLTKHYGVLLLISDDVQSMLSKQYQALTRIVDRTVLPGHDEPCSLYTIDIDLENSGRGETSEDVPYSNSQATLAKQDTLTSLGKNNNLQEDIRNEQRFLFKSLYSKEFTTFQLLHQYNEVQRVLLHTTSPYFKAFKLQYYQAFRLYIEGRWQSALEEFDKCL